MQSQVLDEQQYSLQEIILVDAITIALNESFWHPSPSESAIRNDGHDNTGPIIQGIRYH